VGNLNSLWISGTKGGGPAVFLGEAGAVEEGPLDPGFSSLYRPPSSPAAASSSSVVASEVVRDKGGGFSSASLALLRMDRKRPSGDPRAKKA
jgi:hypothetical protein